MAVNSSAATHARKLLVAGVLQSSYMQYTDAELYCKGTNAELNYFFETKAYTFAFKNEAWLCKTYGLKAQTQIRTAF